MLRELGQRLSLVTRASTGILEAGEGHLVAGRALGWRYIAVLPCEDDALAATRFALGDNRSAALAVIDEDRLTEQFLADALDDGAQDLPLLVVGYAAQLDPPGAALDQVLAFDLRGDDGEVAGGRAGGVHAQGGEAEAEQGAARFGGGVVDGGGNGGWLGEKAVTYFRTAFPACRASTRGTRRPGSRGTGTRRSPCCWPTAGITRHRRSWGSSGTRGRLVAQATDLSPVIGLVYL